jgi:uncharacterized protein (DUF1330 family)
MSKQDINFMQSELNKVLKNLQPKLNDMNKLVDTYKLQSTKAVLIGQETVMASLNAKKVVLLEFETEEKAKGYYDSLKNKTK